MSMKITTRKRMNVLKADHTHIHGFCIRKSFWKGKMLKRIRINLSNTISVLLFRLSVSVSMA